MDSTEQAPIAAMTGGLCGLTTTDVADIVDYYDLTPNMPAVADALSTPFDCDAYGDLCSALSTNDAHAYACGAWTDMKAHMSIANVNNRAVNRLRLNGQPCTPNSSACDEICSPHTVTHCSGVWMNGICRAIATCDYFDNIKPLGFEMALPF